MATTPKMKSSTKKAVKKKTAKVETNTNETVSLELPPYFGIAQVSATKTEMQTMLESDAGDIDIVAEDVESVDTAALQLIVAFINEVKEKNKTANWISCSDKLKHSVELLSLNNATNMS